MQSRIYSGHSLVGRLLDASEGVLRCVLGPITNKELTTARISVPYLLDLVSCVYRTSIHILVKMPRHASICISKMHPVDPQAPSQPLSNEGPSSPPPSRPMAKEREKKRPSNGHTRVILAASSHLSPCATHKAPSNPDGTVCMHPSLSETTHSSLLSTLLPYLDNIYCSIDIPSYQGTPYCLTLGTTGRAVTSHCCIIAPAKFASAKKPPKRPEPNNVRPLAHDTSSVLAQDQARKLNRVVYLAHISHIR